MLGPLTKDTCGEPSRLGCAFRSPIVGGRVVRFFESLVASGDFVRVM